MKTNRLSARLGALPLLACAALALTCLALPPLATSAAAQSRAEKVAWEHAVLRHSTASSSGYSIAFQDQRMLRHQTWGSLLKEMLGRRTDTELTRDADELTVLDFLGMQGWELVSHTDRARMRDGTSVGTEHAWIFKRAR